MRAKPSLMQDIIAKKVDIKYTMLTKTKSGAANKPGVRIMVKITGAPGVSIKDSIR